MVFSTKDRRPLIDSDIRPRLHAYMSEILRDIEPPQSQAYRVGGVADSIVTSWRCFCVWHHLVDRCAVVRGSIAHALLCSVCFDREFSLFCVRMREVTMR